MTKKVKTEYETYINVKSSRKTKQRSAYISKLDKLFDICSCRCDFVGHSDNCGDGCDKQHINCKCAIKDKIPTLELAFIKDQRSKVGGTGVYQLGTVDPMYERKRRRAQSRYEERIPKRKTVSSPDKSVFHEVPRVSSTSSEDLNDTVFEAPASSSEPKVDLSGVAREADRFNVSTRATAALITAALIAYGIVTKDDTSACVTRCKIRHAVEKYRKTVDILGDEEIKAIYLDGRKDETKQKSKDESGTIRYKTSKEEHYVLTSEPEGTYITHVVVSDGKAITITEAVYSAICDFEALESVEVLGSDTTNTMSGAIGGVTTS